MRSSRRSIARSRLSRGPILDLTGGFDSRAVVAAAIAAGRPFECVVNGRDEDADVVAAQRIAAKLGLRLARLRPGIDYGLRSLAAIERAAVLADCEFDAVEYSCVLEIHERLARQGDVTVNGTAGELCRGYWWDLLALAPGRATHSITQRPRAGSSPTTGPTGSSPPPPRPSLAAHFEDVVRRANAGLEDLPNTVRADNLYLRLRMHRWAGPSRERDRPHLALRDPVHVPAAARARPHRADLGPRPRAHDAAAHRAPEPGAREPADGGRLARRADRALQLLALRAARSPRTRARPPRVFGARPASVRVGVRTPPLRARSPTSGRRKTCARCFSPAAMKTASLYNPAALASFLDASQQPGFTDSSKLGRILTLELAAQALARVRQP